MTQPLAQGELLYVTNDQRLYIGNGSTLGGIQITGYTNEDAQDAVAQLFSNGSHTGINFTYNDTSASLSAVLDLSNFAGTIKADAFKGSVFADDGSTVGGQPLVDAISGTFNGNLVGNVTGNTTGTHTGAVVGNVTGNLIGNTTGFHTGDVRGTVSGDDSTILVDGVSNILSNGVISFTGTQFISTTRLLTIGAASDTLATTLEFNQVDANPPVVIKNISNSNFGLVSKFTVTGYGGSLVSPTNVPLGDVVGAMTFNTWNPAAASEFPSGIIVVKTDPDGVVNSTNANGKIEFSVDGGTVGLVQKFMTFDSKGRLAVNQQTATATLDVAGTIRASGYTVATLPAGTVGMTAYVTDALSPTFLGTLTGGGTVKCPVFYNGSAWVAG
jgi:hypothetical protein